MRKLLILLISISAFGQSLNTFTSGQIIDKNLIDQNFRHLENYASEYHIPLTLNSYLYETVIKSDKFNQDITTINTKFNPNTPTNDIVPLSGSITYTKINDLFIDAKAFITGYLGQSCKDLLQKNPTLTNDGFYKIKPTDSPSDFWVFCDMQQGGWTLIFDHALDNISIQYENGHPIFFGNHTLTNNIIVQSNDGNTTTISYSDMQKAVKYVKGQYIKFPANKVAKSTTVSSFATKLSQQTPWDNNFTDSETGGHAAL